MLQLKCKNPLYWIWNVRRCCKCSLNLPCWIQAVEKSWAFYSSYANWLRWVKASQYDSLRLWCLFPVCIQISWACNAAPLPESCKQQHCSAGDTITVSDGLSDSGFCHHLQEESTNWTVSQRRRSAACCQRDKHCHWLLLILLCLVEHLSAEPHDCGFQSISVHYLTKHSLPVIQLWGLFFWWFPGFPDSWSYVWMPWSVPVSDMINTIFSSGCSNAFVQTRSCVRLHGLPLRHIRSSREHLELAPHNTLQIRLEQFN